PADVVAVYHQRMTGDAGSLDAQSTVPAQAALTLTTVTPRAADDPAASPRSGAPLSIAVRYTASRPLRVRFRLSYHSADYKTLVARTVAGDADGINVLAHGGV